MGDTSSNDYVSIVLLVFGGVFHWFICCRVDCDFWRCFKNLREMYEYCGEWCDLNWPNIYIYIPGTQMTSIFEGQPPKKRPFPIKTRVIWVPGIYIYTYVFLQILGPKVTLLFFAKKDIWRLVCTSNFKLEKVEKLVLTKRGEKNRKASWTQKTCHQYVSFGRCIFEIIL